jgi:hypothetical protein
MPRLRAIVFFLSQILEKHADVTVAQIVSENENDVRFFFGGARLRGKISEQQRGCEQRNNLADFHHGKGRFNFLAGFTNSIFNRGEF